MEDISFYIVLENFVKKGKKKNNNNNQIVIEGILLIIYNSWFVKFHNIDISQTVHVGNKINETVRMNA